MFWRSKVHLSAGHLGRQPSGNRLLDHSYRPAYALPMDRTVYDHEEMATALEVLQGRHIVVLSGAGISTESGIPDYRGADTPRRKTPPIQYREFIGSEAARTRYWARSAIGWPRFSAVRPNPAHAAVAQLERAGIVTGVITQNVDRLHQAAGSEHVVELHGALAEVLCLQCGAIETRNALQRRMLTMNPGWEAQNFNIAPDGDADLPEEITRGFRVPTCLRCGGILKPNIVFFGENVPRERVDAAFVMVSNADAVLVAGSSLTVYSGFRFVERAARAGTPVVIFNIGPTRGDALARVRVDAPLGSLLPHLSQMLIS